MTTILVSLLITLAALLSASIASDFIHDEPIGISEKQGDSSHSESSSKFPFVKAGEDFVGRVFIGLPTPYIPSRKYAFRKYRCGVSAPKYAQIAGKKFRVTAFQEKKRCFKIQLLESEKKCIVSYLAIQPYLEEAALFSEFEGARDKYQGKKLWRTKRYLTIMPDLTKNPSKIKVKKYSPVMVQKVVLGSMPLKPIKFIVKTADDRVGYVEATVSGSNPGLLGKEYNQYFHEEFLTEDPRKKYKWSQEIWRKIEEGKISKGMTEEQVKMSWGPPKKVNASSSGINDQWVYSSSYLYFSKGKLTSWQTSRK